MAITACIDSITRSEAIFSSSSSAGDFTARSRSSTNSASTISASGRLLLSAAAESIGRNAISTPTRFTLPIFLTCSTAFFTTSTEPDDEQFCSGVQNGFTSRWKFSSRWPKNAAFSGAPFA